MISVSLDDLLNKFPSIDVTFKNGSPVSTAAPTGYKKPAEGSTVYLNELGHLDHCLKSKVSFIFIEQNKKTDTEALEICKKYDHNFAILTVENLQLSMAKINSYFFKPQENLTPFDGQLVHPSSQVHSKAQIGRNVIIHPGAVIGAGVRIGDNCIIGCNTVIEKNVTIGANCHIHPLVSIGFNCIIGNNVNIKTGSCIGTQGFGYAQDDKGNHFHKPHYGVVILEDNVHVGSNVCMDKGTFEDSVFGEGTIIDNHCHFAHNTVVGKRCIMTAGFIVAGSTTIGDQCVFGGRSSLAGHINITDHVHFAGVSTTTKSVTKPGAYGGYPLQPLNDFLKSNASIAKLPYIRKMLSAILKKVDI